MADDPQDEQAPPPKKRRLTLKQRAFIANYTNPESKTYSNGTQSVLAIPGRRGKGSYNAANNQAVQYLQSPTVISEIEVQLNQAGLGNMFRLGALHAIAGGQYVRTVRHKTGKRVTVSTETPKASEVIKAIDVVNKMSGLYEKNRVLANNTTQRFKELARQFRPVPVDATPKTKRIGVDEHKSIQPKVKSHLCGFLPCYVEQPTAQASSVAHGGMA